MRPCATVNLLASGLVLSVVLFAACTGGSAPGSVGGPPAQPGSGSPNDVAAVEGTASAAPPAGTAAEAPRAKKDPATAADCKELLSEITNEPPDGGVVMNNAMIASDAGSSDRLAPMIELFRSKRDAFRCCFDVWAKKNPGVPGKVVFVVDLKPDGALKEARVDAANSVDAPEMSECMVDLAKTLTFPRSPSGKDTTYTHRFEFQARK